MRRAVLRWRCPRNLPRSGAVVRVYERYVGLHGQERVGLVDEVGRVHHFDVADLPDDQPMVANGETPPTTTPSQDDYEHTYYGEGEVVARSLSAPDVLTLLDDAELAFALAVALGSGRSR